MLERAGVRFAGVGKNLSAVRDAHAVYPNSFEEDFMIQSAMKWTFRALGASVGLGLLATSAFAAQNVANTSQKGSLLVFPLVDQRPGVTTTIRIANDANVQVDVKCYYINQTKFRRDFLFKLTKKQAVAFDARTGSTDVHGNLPPFPTDTGNFPLITATPARNANPFLGELICFAVNPAGSVQISHNHLSGTATVGTNAIPVDSVLQNAYEYTAWAFTARNAPQGTPVGAPGRLDLTGAAGAYDACPAYNIVHLAPTVPIVDGPIVAADQRIGVSLCAQDLRQDFTPHFTKLELHIWNAHEVKFTGAWECSDSTHSFLLSETDTLPGNLARETLGTDAAFMQIRGVASTQCRPPTPFVTETVGLVAASARVLRLGEGGETPLHGTTANTAGFHAVPGFILWDPQDATVPEAPQR
jgi:hypothetical protein